MPRHPRAMKRILLVVAIAACSKSASAPPPAQPLPPAAAPAPTEEAPPAEATPADAPKADAPKAAQPAPKKAQADLEPASKSKVKGTATFVEADGGVEVTISVEGLTPGDHGWHVHEKGDCSAPDA